MPVLDCTLPNIAAGVRTSWAADATLSAIIPASRLFLQRSPEGTALPYCVFRFEDVSAFFGGTEYLSGPIYIKETRVLFAVYALPTTDLEPIGQAAGNAFGWSSTSPRAGWVIPNATVIHAVPETEDLDVTDERVSGEDVVTYPFGFTLKLEANRG